MRRELKVQLNDKTLQDLIAVYLQQMCVIEYSEAIADITIGTPDNKGIRTIKFVLEPDVQTIYH